jgi:hypothetical protein
MTRNKNAGRGFVLVMKPRKFAETSCRQPSVCGQEVGAHWFIIFRLPEVTRGFNN